MLYEQQDNADLRRGTPAFHVSHGEATTILPLIAGYCYHKDSGKGRGEKRYSDRRHQHRRKAPRDQHGDRPRRDQHGDGEDDPHRFQRADNGQREQAQQPVMQQPHRQAALAGDLTQDPLGVVHPLLAQVVAVQRGPRHQTHEAMRMADQILLMRNGKVVQRGAPYNLYNAPVDRAAAVAARSLRR